MTTRGSTPDAVLRDSLKAGLDASALRRTDAHVDLGLPDRITTDADLLGQGMAALCAWLRQAGPSGQQSIAIWRDAAAPSDGRDDPHRPQDPIPILIEAAHSLGPATGTGGLAGALRPSPAQGRAGVGALVAKGCTRDQTGAGSGEGPHGGAGALPSARNPGPGALAEAAAALGAEILHEPATADGIERLGLRFSAHAAPAALPLASHWGGALRGRRLLILRHAALDPGRLARSFAALGLAARVETEPEAALAAATEAADRCQPYDFALICPHSLGEAGVGLVDRLRALPAHAPRIVLVTHHDTDPAQYPGVDSVVPQRRHWRRVIDALFDLAHAGAKAAPPPSAALPVLTGRRILIAEDVRTNQALLRAMLAPTGAIIAVASDGAEAVAAMQAAPADLVLMDIQMPVMDGLEAARQIRAMRLPARIIALTAHARDADRARYLALGMDGYLAKPIRVDDLYAALSEVLAAEPEGTG